MIHNKMSVIELLPEDELLSLQKEKELLTEKRAAGIKLLAELNAQLNVVRSLKMQETLWMKNSRKSRENWSIKRICRMLWLFRKRDCFILEHNGKRYSRI